jgi:CheY-like chemotaxis protein
LLTASSTPPSRQALASTGFCAAHVKPTATAQLQTVIAMALLGRHAEAEVQPQGLTKRYAGRTVLVAEDNAVNRQVIGAMLRQLGANVEVVEDGAEALKHVLAMHRGESTSTIDCILMDCEMPNMDGYAATRQIRQHERASGRENLPIIALTAHALPEYQQRSSEAGMNAHLNKPISLVALNEMLGRFIAPADALG